MQHVPFQLIAIIIPVVLIAFIILKSLVSIGASEFGLVTKKIGKKLPEGQLIAFKGEAGYQAQLLDPGLRLRIWPIYSVRRMPLVQVGPNSVGLVVAQVGNPLPAGAKSGVYNPAFGDFRDVSAFLNNGGQLGIQRPVLPPGTTVRLHPVAFIVVTPEASFGQILSDETQHTMEQIGQNTLRPVDIQPNGNIDLVGIVRTLEGPPLDSNDMASRIGGYDDIKALEASNTAVPEIIEAILGSKNSMHNNYQDFQAFLDNGGRIGLQHDPLQYGRYILNPYLVQVETVPMLVVRQGEVAVIKSFVGLPTVDTSGVEFKFGSLVSPGHRGIWHEPLRTGKYPINPRIYAAEIVPTSILTLNWAQATSVAHELDKSLSAIRARSSDAFEFSIDLQVQIHVPDTRAPKVISMVGTMLNLVNEVLQSAVGNYFRNKLQQLKAIAFIQTRDMVQAEAEQYIKDYLNKYEVEVRGVYIQDVVFPEDLTKVLRDREIAAQEEQTYGQQRTAEVARIELEKTRGTADAQGDLARAQVSIEIQTATAEAVTAGAQGTAAVTRLTGEADADRITAIGNAEASAERARGLAKAAAYVAQRDAIGAEQTALVAVLHEIAAGNVRITPDITAGGSEGGLGNALVAMVAAGFNADRNSNAAAATSSTLTAPALPVKPASDEGDVPIDDEMNN